MPILYVVGVPIGNLDDVTKRALDVLSAVDYVLAEDTRESSKLLSRFKISKPFIILNEHAEEKTIRKIIELLNNGKNLALITDAGTPAISDPGGKLIERVWEEVAKKEKEKIKIVPVPGASAVTAALCVAGLPADRFVFLGFPPHKKRRSDFFRKIKIFSEELTVVMFESPHRIRKTIGEIVSAFLADSAGRADFSGTADFSDRVLFLGRELTKKFETLYRFRISFFLSPDFTVNSSALEKIPEKGEYVIIVGPKGY